MLSKVQFSEERQMHRAQAVLNLLQQDGLDEWAYGFWHNVLETLSKNEVTYNYRAKLLDMEIQKRKQQNGSN